MPFVLAHCDDQHNGNGLMALMGTALMGMSCKTATASSLSLSPYQDCCCVCVCVQRSSHMPHICINAVTTVSDYMFNGQVSCWQVAALIFWHDHYQTVFSGPEGNLPHVHLSPSALGRTQRRQWQVFCPTIGLVKLYRAQRTKTETRARKPEPHIMCPLIRSVHIKKLQPQSKTSSK
jgi:hypothetical protein